MGNLTVKVPDVGEGVAEVELVSWAVQPGDTVEKHQVLAEVMTDKANVEIPAPAAGVVSMITGSAGDVLAVGSDLIELTLDDGAAPSEATRTDDAPTEAEPAPDAEPAEVPAAPVHVERTEITEPPSPAGAVGSRSASPPRRSRPRASPAVRAHARELGVDLNDVTGSGPDGRILHSDLPAPATTRGPAGTEPGAANWSNAIASSVEPIIGMRRRISERMLTATSSIPHITYVEEVDMTRVLELRADLNSTSHADAPRLSLLPFLIRAVAISAADVPYVNAHVDDDAGEIRVFDQVDVGVATQTPRGLVVPVLRAAGQRSLWDLAGGVARLAETAKDGSIAAADLSGSTITISSLGELGGLVSTPIINKPETAVVGVNKLVTRPVWIDGQFVPRKMMNLSSSFDHRVIDGYDAATFIGAVKRLLEQPALLFIDPA